MLVLVEIYYFCLILCFCFFIEGNLIELVMFFFGKSKKWFNWVVINVGGVWYEMFLSMLKIIFDIWFFYFGEYYIIVVWIFEYDVFK